MSKRYERGSAYTLPTGFDVNEYPDFKSWSSRRWAWEFLRRNPEFIEACNSADPESNSDAKEIAAKFGLKAFKHYSEEYYSR